MLIVQKLYANSNNQYKEHKKWQPSKMIEAVNDMTTTIRSRIMVDDRR